MTKSTRSCRRLAAIALLLSAALFLVPAGTKSATGGRLVAGPVIGDVQKNQATITFTLDRETGVLGSQRVVDFYRVIIKGLRPGKAYSYDMTRYGAKARVNFTTAPKGSSPFTFIAYGDTRTRHDVHAKVVARLHQEKPAFLLHTGDLVGDGTKTGDWDKFFEICGKMFLDVPFYATVGNHERNDPAFFKYFAFPGDNGQRYSFDWGSAHFVAFNSLEVGNNKEEREAFVSAQLDWLREDLRRNRQPLTFVMFHNPLYTVVEKRTVESEKLRVRLEPILLEGGVTAVFNGHDHNYQHHLQSGLHHIVTGGGGAPLYDGKPIPGITLKLVKTENYVRVKVNGDIVQIEALDIEGNIIDSFAVEGRKAAPPTAGSGMR